ncbi:MAG: hypothetical protein F2826_10615, partial [Actinobacteria bacterium]|nr:hypothetical protein [Actinomycetota bacterium]
MAADHRPCTGLTQCLRSLRSVHFRWKSLKHSSNSPNPTCSLDELAARKLLALFDRAMPRDFVDVYALTRDRMPDALLQNAREIDPGID